MIFNVEKIKDVIIDCKQALSELVTDGELTVEEAVMIAPYVIQELIKKVSLHPDSE